MKKLKLLVVLLTFKLALGLPPAFSQNTFIMDREASYAIGMYLASQFNIPDVGYDYSALIEGFKAYNEAQGTWFSMDDALTKIQSAFELYELRENERSQAEGQVNIEEGRAFLAANSKKAGVTSLPSGLQYRVISEGTGSRPGASDVVRVHYEGTLINGSVFDSSYTQGTPVEFPLTAVIAGWTEGLQLMREGSIFELYIPYDLAYGSRSIGNIPAYSTLIFKVELLSVIR